MDQINRHQRIKQTGTMVVSYNRVSFRDIHLHFIRSRINTKHNRHLSNVCEQTQVSYPGPPGE